MRHLPFVVTFLVMVSSPFGARAQFLHEPFADEEDPLHYLACFDPTNPTKKYDCERPEEEDDEPYDPNALKDALLERNQMIYESCDRYEGELHPLTLEPIICDNPSSYPR